MKTANTSTTTPAGLTERLLFSVCVDYGILSSNMRTPLEFAETCEWVSCVCVEGVSPVGGGGQHYIAM